MTVQAVAVREGDPPAAGGVPWRRVTPHAVEGLADARARVAFQRRRRCIEQVCRTLKTKGFDIEPRAWANPPSGQRGARRQARRTDV